MRKGPDTPRAIAKRAQAAAWQLTHPEETKARKREWARAHPDKMAAWRQHWREANRDAIREHGKQFYNANPALTKKRRDAWRRANPDKARAEVRNWRAKNPEKLKASQRKSRLAGKERRAVTQAQRQARRKLAGGRGVSLQAWRELVASSLGVCAYCNKRRPLTMDHIHPLSTGGEHDIDNIAAACASCNSSKRNMPLLVWLAKRAS